MTDHEKLQIGVRALEKTVPMPPGLRRSLKN
jgi:hypothetical protein